MGKYYAVKNGRECGIYDNWNDCKSQVNGYKGAQFKSFPTREAAEAYSGSSASGGSGSVDYSYGGYGGYNGYGGYQGGRYASSSSRTVSNNHRSAPRASSSSRTHTSNVSRPTSERTVVYTDGSSLGNGKRGAKAGWASYWGSSDGRNSSGPVTTGEQTNNRGELIAIHETLRQIDSEVKEGRQPSEGYLIRADSHYARDSLDKWTKGWEAKGWKTSTGGDVKNRDIIEPAHTLLKELRQEGVPVEIEYVPAHSGHEGNESADLMARAAAEKSTGP